VRRRAARTERRGRARARAARPLPGGPGRAGGARTVRRRPAGLDRAAVPRTQQYPRRARLVGSFGLECAGPGVGTPTGWFTVALLAIAGFCPRGSRAPRGAAHRGG